MSLVITVNDIFTITSDNEVVITKDRFDIMCCVSKSDLSVVEIWETTSNENGRNLIFSTLYSNISTPQGTSASEIVDAIKTLITS